MYPSAASITAAQAAWYDRTTSRMSSGSRRSDSAVEFARSQNITVRWRRSPARSGVVTSRPGGDRGGVHLLRQFPGGIAVAWPAAGQAQAGPLQPRARHPDRSAQALMNGGRLPEMAVRLVEAPDGRRQKSEKVIGGPGTRRAYVRDQPAMGEQVVVERRTARLMADTGAGPGNEGQAVESAVVTGQVYEVV